jgi:peroxiredoxin Q/BCP
MLKEGTQAPEFEATLDSGETLRLADLRGKQNLVLYFYPKDFTMGCTREACSFRDNYGEVTKYDAMLVGVSTDSVDSHQRFRERHELPFPLIADTDKTLVRLFDADGLFGITTARVTYVIDKQGVIRDAFRHDFAIGRHLSDVLEALRAIEGEPVAGGTETTG